MTERLHFHFPLSCIGEGNGNPLQCSCLENPRDRGAWWAVSGVAQSRTQLKRFSSSNSSKCVRKELLRGKRRVEGKENHILILCLQTHVKVGLLHKNGPLLSVYCVRHC